MLGIFLDTETNGLNSQVHKILEIAYRIVDLKTGKTESEFQTIVGQPFDVWEKSNPESLKINGFTWEMVKEGQNKTDISQHIIDQFSRFQIRRHEAVFICQNPSFDRVFFSQIVDPDTQEVLKWPYHWFDLASMFWAVTMQKAKNHLSPPPWEMQFSKNSIATHYHLPAEQMPHRAMGGVDHLLLCYKAVVGFPFEK